MSEKICKRLRELSDAVTKDRRAMEREFTMEVPANEDRDADLVLRDAANLIEQLEAENALYCPKCLLEAERDALKEIKCASCGCRLMKVLCANCGD